MIVENLITYFMHKIIENIKLSSGCACKVCVKQINFIFGSITNLSHCACVYKCLKLKRLARVKYLASKYFRWGDWLCKTWRMIGCSSFLNLPPKLSPVFSKASLELFCLLAPSPHFRWARPTGQAHQDRMCLHRLVWLFGPPEAAGSSLSVSCPGVCDTVLHHFTLTGILVSCLFFSATPCV